MSDSDKEQMAKWVETWNRAGSALKEIKRRELQRFDYAKNQAIIDEMLQWAFDNRTVRLSSGLVEQQKIFMKMQKKQKQLSNDETHKGNP